MVSVVIVRVGVIVMAGVFRGKRRLLVYFW